MNYVQQALDRGDRYHSENIGGNIHAATEYVNKALMKGWVPSGSKATIHGISNGTSSIVVWEFPSPTIQPELVRGVVNHIKKLSLLRDPPYDMPSERHIEKTAIEIIESIRKFPPA